MIDMNLWKSLNVYSMVMLVAAISGCVDNSTYAATRPAAAQLERIVPTLIEPRVPASERQFWYRDRFTNNDESLFDLGGALTFDDLQALRASHANLVEVLEVADMPILRDVGLISHAASLLNPPDQGARPLLADLENQGHRLAAAARLDPSEAQWIDDNLQSKRPALNGLASRAARGDEQALRQLSQFSDHLRQSSLHEPVISALHSLTAAQHFYRVRLGATPTSDAAFVVLRRFSYVGVLDRQDLLASLECTTINLQTGGHVACAGPPDRKVGCFALTGGSWDAFEVKSYKSACIKPDSDLVSIEEKTCTSREGEDEFDRQLNSPIHAPIVIAKTLELRQRYEFELKGRLRSQGVVFTNVTEEEKGKNVFYCDVTFDWSDGDPEARDSIGYKVMLSKNATARFRAEPDSQGKPVLRLTYLMGTAVGSTPESVPQSAGRRAPPRKEPEPVTKPSGSAEGPAASVLKPIVSGEARTLVSGGGAAATSVHFINHYGSEVTLAWVDFGGKVVNYATLKPNDAYTQSTYASHVWLVFDKSNGQLIEGFRATERGADAVIARVAK
jgi:hypothetical protein